LGFFSSLRLLNLPFRFVFDDSCVETRCFTFVWNSKRSLTELAPILISMRSCRTVVISCLSGVCSQEYTLLRLADLFGLHQMRYFEVNGKLLRHLLKDSTTSGSIANTARVRLSDDVTCKLLAELRRAGFPVNFLTLTRFPHSVPNSSLLRCSFCSRSCCDIGVERLYCASVGQETTLKVLSLSPHPGASTFLAVLRDNSAGLTVCKVCCIGAAERVKGQKHFHRAPSCVLLL